MSEKLRISRRNFLERLGNITLFVSLLDLLKLIGCSPDVNPNIIPDGNGDSAPITETGITQQDLLAILEDQNFFATATELYSQFNLDLDVIEQNLVDSNQVNLHELGEQLQANTSQLSIMLTTFLRIVRDYLPPDTLNAMEQISGTEQQVDSSQEGANPHPGLEAVLNQSGELEPLAVAFSAISLSETARGNLDNLSQLVKQILLKLILESRLILKLKEHGKLQHLDEFSAVIILHSAMGFARLLETITNNNPDLQGSNGLIVPQGEMLVLRSLMAECRGLLANHSPRFHFTAEQVGDMTEDAIGQIINLLSRYEEAQIASLGYSSEAAEQLLVDGNSQTQPGVSLTDPDLTDDMRFLLRNLMPALRAGLIKTAYDLGQLPDETHEQILAAVKQTSNWLVDEGHLYLGLRPEVPSQISQANFTFSGPTMTVSLADHTEQVNIKDLGFTANEAIFEDSEALGRIALRKPYIIRMIIVQDNGGLNHLAFLFEGHQTALSQDRGLYILNYSGEICGHQIANRGNLPPIQWLSDEQKVNEGLPSGFKEVRFYSSQPELLVDNAIPLKDFIRTIMLHDVEPGQANTPNTSLFAEAEGSRAFFQVAELNPNTEVYTVIDGEFTKVGAFGRSALAPIYTNVIFNFGTSSVQEQGIWNRIRPGVQRNEQVYFEIAPDLFVKSTDVTIIDYHDPRQWYELNARIAGLLQSILVGPYGVKYHTVSGPVPVPQSLTNWTVQMRSLNVPVPQTGRNLFYEFVDMITPGNVLGYQAPSGGLAFSDLIGPLQKAAFITLGLAGVVHRQKMLDNPLVRQRHHWMSDREAAYLSMVAVDPRNVVYLPSSN